MRKGLLFALLGLAARTLAQDAPPPVPPEPVIPLIDQMRFGTDGPRMTVPVRIGEDGPYQFIIDTGAQRTVIARDLAAILKLVAGPTVRVTSMSGVTSVPTVLIPSLSVSMIGGKRIVAPALDGGNIGASGLLGIDTLQGHAVSIDFDAQTLTVTPSRRHPSRGDRDRDEIVVVARSLFGQLVVTDAYCDNQRVRVVLDTGSVVTMGNEALRRKLSARKLIQPIVLTSVVGGKLDADYTTIDRITIGGLTIADLPIAFADAAPFRQFGLDKKPAILLGMDALKLFRRVDIDFANREVRLALPKSVRR